MDRKYYLNVSLAFFVSLSVSYCHTSKVKDNYHTSDLGEVLLLTANVRESSQEKVTFTAKCRSGLIETAVSEESILANEVCNKQPLFPFFFPINSMQYSLGCLRSSDELNQALGEKVIYYSLSKEKELDDPKTCENVGDTSALDIASPDGESGYFILNCKKNRLTFSGMKAEELLFTNICDTSGTKQIDHQIVPRQGLGGVTFSLTKDEILTKLNDPGIYDHLRNRSQFKNGANIVWNTNNLPSRMVAGKNYRGYLVYRSGEKTDLNSILMALSPNAMNIHPSALSDEIIPGIISHHNLKGYHWSGKNTLEFYDLETEGEKAGEKKFLLTMEFEKEESGFYFIKAINLIN